MEVMTNAQLVTELRARQITAQVSPGGWVDLGEIEEGRPEFTVHLAGGGCEIIARDGDPAGFSSDDPVGLCTEVLWRRAQG